MTAYAWTGGNWLQVGSSSQTVTAGLAPSTAQFGPYLVSSDSVSIRTVVSDFRVSNMHTDDTVEASKTYCYRVSPSKSAACSWDPAVDKDDLYSEVCTVTAPAAPSALSATVNGMSVTLDWIDNSVDEDGFEILKMLDNGKFVTINTVGPNELSYTDSMAIIPNRFYTYRVRAVRGTDRSGFEQITTNYPTFWQDPICLP